MKVKDCFIKMLNDLENLKVPDECQETLSFLKNNINDRKCQLKQLIDSEFTKEEKDFLKKNGIEE